MADDVTNGSTVTFDSVAIGELTSISFTEDGNPVDVTTLADTFHRFCNGATNIECVVDILGSESSSAVAIGDTGALAVAWNDSGDDAITDAIVTNRETSGDLDGAITTTYTFAPTVASA